MNVARPWELFEDRLRSLSCIECGAATNESKPYCVEHIDRLSYVQELRAKLGKPGRLLPTSEQIALRRSAIHRRWRKAVKALEAVAVDHQKDEQDLCVVALCLAAGVVLSVKRRAASRKCASARAAKAMSWLLTSGACQLCGCRVGQHEKTCAKCARSLLPSSERVKQGRLRWWLAVDERRAREASREECAA